MLGLPMSAGATRGRLRRPQTYRLLVLLACGVAFVVWRSNALEDGLALPGKGLLGPLRAQPAPELAPQLKAPTLTTKRADDALPFVELTHLHPYNGSAFNLATSLHPRKAKDATDYVLSSAWFLREAANLDWLQFAVQELLPSSYIHVHFTCEYARDPNAKSSEWESVPGRKTVQGRTEYLMADCPMPSWLQGRLDTTQPTDTIEAAIDELTRGGVRIRGWLDVGNVNDPAKTSDYNADDIKAKWFTYRESPAAHFDASDETREDGAGNTHVLMFSHGIGADDWQSPEQHVRLGVCLSPMYLNDEPAAAREQLQEAVEWRVWHAYIGVDRVHWYNRDPAFGRWLDRLNEVLGTADDFTHAPLYLKKSPLYHEWRTIYADQAMYNAACLVQNQYADEWLSFHDLDEFLLPRDDPSPNGVVKRLNALPAWVGSIGADHTYYNTDKFSGTPSLDAFPRFPRHAGRLWDTLERHDGYRRQKAIHRTDAVETIWVHSSTSMAWGFWNTDDQPYLQTGDAVKEGDEDIKSHIEFVHDRKTPHDGLEITREMTRDTAELWGGAWATIADILSDERLIALTDPAFFAA